ncbi:MAG: ATP-binding protein [Pseudomonadota bacterium]
MRALEMLLGRLAARRVSIALVASVALAALVTLVLLAFAVLSYNAERDERWRELHRALDASADQLAAAVALPAWNFDERQIAAIMRASLNNRDLYGGTITLGKRMQFVFLRDEHGGVERAAAPPDLPALRIAERPISMGGREIGSVKMYVTPRHVLQTLRERRIALACAIVALDVTLVLGVYLLLWYLMLKPLKAVGRYATAVKAGGAAGALPQQSLFLGELKTLNESILDMVTLLDLRYRAMQASEERLSIATNAANIGIWDWDVASGALMWDPEMHRQYGVAPERFSGRLDAWEACLVPEDLERVNRLVEAVGRGEGEYATEFRIVWPDGQLRHIKTAAKTMRDGDGRMLRMVGVNYDITDMKRTEHELLRHRHHLEELVAERTAALSVAVTQAKAANHAKSVFLATMSHELRTPLHSVIGFSRLLADSQSMTDEEKRNLGVIHRSGQHLLTLINDLLELSKIEAGRITLQSSVVGVEGLLREVMEMLGARARQAGLTMTVDCVGVPAAVRIDGARLRQVLLNLVSNAVKFAQQGSVTLMARALRRDDGFYDLSFAVRDTGQGIAKADQERIFEPFVQTGSTGAQEGTGLGLTISREFVHMMGGMLEVESDPGNGAVFRFTVRVESAEHDAGDAPGTVLALEPSQRGRRILVADGREDSAQRIDALLSPLGFIVDAAADGAAALAAIERGAPALVLIDSGLPGLGEADLVRRLRTSSDAVPPRVVMMGASSIEQMRREAHDAGADEFLCQPVEQDKLFQVLEQQLGVRFRRRQRVPTILPAPLTTARLALLPYEVLMALREALHVLNPVRALQLLEPYQQEHADTVRAVDAMLAQHQYPQLCGMIEAICLQQEA